jgi:hypothetical protein
MSPAEIETVLQRAQLELWRDNVAGALQTLEAANVRWPHPRFTALREQIRSWLRHLESREAYGRAYESYYNAVKRDSSLLRRADERLRRDGAASTVRAARRRGRTRARL